MSNFILLRVDIQLVQHHLLKLLSFPIEWLCHSHLKSINHRRISVFLDSQFYSIDQCVYPHLPVSHCLDYCSFVITLKLGSENLTLFFFFDLIFFGFFSITTWSPYIPLPQTLLNKCTRLNIHRNFDPSKMDIKNNFP